MVMMPPIDISDDHWNILKDILQRHVPDREIWAFGSRVKGTAKPFSDLDIAIICDVPMGIGLLAELKESFQDSVLPFKVDVVDWAATPEPFRNVISKSKVVLLDLRSK